MARIVLPEYNRDFESNEKAQCVNDLPYTTDADIREFNNVLLTTYDSDILSDIPSCRCGHTAGTDKLGATCPKCLGVVAYSGEEDIGENMWLRTPNGILGWIVPVVFQKLTTMISPKGYNVMEWLLNPSMPVPSSASATVGKKIAILERAQIPRGINNFINNFDTFLELLPLLANKKNIGEAYRTELSNTPRDVIFPTYLPFPTKALLVLENTPVGSFADTPRMTDAIDAARAIADLSRPRIRPLTPKEVEKRTLKILLHIIEFIAVTQRTTITKKSGWYRQHLYSWKSHFSMRAVVTSIQGPHDYDEIHVPWECAVETFRVHLSGLLLERGHTIVETNQLLEKHTVTYHPTIDECFKELIAMAAPDKGIQCMIQRNPSQDRLSAQCVFITKVKTDTNDKTISLSDLIVKGMNCDHDGDNNNVTIAIGDEMIKAFKRLRSHFGIHSRSSLGKISPVANLPAVTIVNLHNAIRHSLRGINLVEAQSIVDRLYNN